MKYIKITATVFFGLVLLCSPMLGQEKLAQTGFQFLSVGADARSAAMAEAFTSVGAGANALFYNPAGLSHTEKFLELAVNFNSWIAEINHSSAALIINPKDGSFGTFGLSLQWVDYGDFEGTIRSSNSVGYEDTGIFSPTAIALGLGYGKSLTDRFSIGGQVKLVAQSLGRGIDKDPNSPSGLVTRQNTASVYAYDFGTIYNTGFRSIVFGMSVRNFSQEFKYEEESFQLPLTFRMGISANVFEFLEMQSEEHQMLLSIDAVHPRSYPEFMNMGLEYKFASVLSLRGGYASNQDEYGLTYGFGLNSFGVGFNYAYTPFGVFGGVQRITANLSL